MKILLVGYGSLLNLSSLRDTLNISSFTPVIIKGYKRIFNVKLSSSKTSDVLNIVKSKRHYFNGLMFQVDYRQLKMLIKREEPEYHLHPVEAIPFTAFKNSSRSPLINSFVFVDEYIHLDKKKRLPNKDYFIFCRQSAYSVGKEFGKSWDNTTYLASGEKISSWLKRSKEYDHVNP